MAALFGGMLWTAARIGSSLVECEKLTCKRGVSPCNICDGLRSCISSVLLPHGNFGFRCDAVVINCPSEHSATVDEEVVGRECYLPLGEERRRSPEGARDLCLKQSRDP